MNSTIETLKKRVSLRNYANKDISDEHLDMILEAAMRAPTAGNMMPYSIIVIKDESMKEKLSHTCDEQPFIAKAPVLLVFVADYQKWFDYYRMNHVNEFCKKNNRLFTVPSVGNLMLSIEDAIIACQNAVIASESLGIGSCYIGDIMEQYETHKELLNLPKYAFPVAMLCLGYYEDGYEKIHRGRFDKKYVVFNEQYQPLNEGQIKDMYRELDKRYTYPNRFNSENFAQSHYAFKYDSDFSKEMTRSIKEVIKIWSGEKYVE